MSTCVLHILPANSGGVARFVRTIREHRPGDRALHVTSRQWALELGQPSLFLPIDAALSSEHIRVLCSQVTAIHAHSCLTETRSAIRQLQLACGLEYGITLHDIAFADETELAPEVTERKNFLHAARFITVPSSYIEQLLTHFCPNIKPELVAHGSALTMDDKPWQPLTALPSVEFPIVVLGAIGQHKGLDRLMAIAEALPAGTRIAVIGYIDGGLNPGWLIPDRLWMTGPFEPEHLASIVQALRSRVAFFPNRQPESFSYALSDAWQAGLYAVVPDSGALAERVRGSGSEVGVCYSVDAEPEAIVAMLDAAIIRANPASVKAYARVPKLEETISRLSFIYAAVPGPQAGLISNSIFREADLPIQAQLDDRFFRAELRRLLQQLNSIESHFSAREELLKGRLDACQDLSQKRHQEIERLERLLQDTLAQAKKDAEQMHNDLSAASAAIRKLERDVADTLAIAHHQQRALAKLPQPLRNWLLDATRLS